MSDMYDDRAEVELTTLLLSVAPELVRLGTQPVAIACATGKFNDAYEDDYWCAVRVGRFHWEQSQFFASEDFPGYATERGRLPVNEGGQGTPKLEKQSIDAGRYLLAKLERAGWRSLLDRAAGRKSDGCVVALIYALDQLWLSVTDPLGCSWETLYALHPKGLIAFATACERMDQLIGRPNLLRVEDVEISALTSISDAARQSFCPELVSADAANNLRNCLADAGKDIRAETKEVMIVSLASADFKKAKYSEITNSWPETRFWLRDVYYRENDFRNLETTLMHEGVRQARIDKFKLANFPKLASIVDLLNKKDPRYLLEQAFGIETFDDEEILFVVKDSSLYLIHEAKLFVVRGGLKPSLGIPSPGPSISFLGYVKAGQLGIGSPEPFAQFNLEDPNVLSRANLR